MATLSQTITRLSRLMVFGFHGPRARQMKVLVMCQWLAVAAFLFVWIKINGGLWPSFLQTGSDASKLRGVLNANLVDHFVSAQHDGSMVTWSHAANSRDALRKALMSDGVMMIEGDVLLRGQNTASQQMIPVMAQPPEVTSDLTLVEWLALVKGRGKGIKLDFKSIEAVEISLQRLNEIKEELNGPLHLSAAVVDSRGADSSSDRPLDAGRFMRLCTTHAPDCTLALGWVTESRSRRYNWADVKAMYDLVDRWQVKQPVTFNVRAHLARSSMSQLKWLLEMTPSSTMTVVSSGGDVPAPLHDLAYVRRRVPRHAVFYDLPRDDHVRFSSVRDSPVTDSGRRDLVEMDEQRAFTAEQWKVVRSREGETIYLGTQSVLLQTGLLMTKAEYPATPQRPVYITGRVEFFGRPVAADDTRGGGDDVRKDASSRQDEMGLSVFLRASQSSRPDSISGVRCFLSVGGEIRLELLRIPGFEAAAHAVLPGTSPCLAFRITDGGTGGISVRVIRPKSCDADFDVVDSSGVDFETKLELPLKDVVTDSAYVAIKQSVPVGFAAVDRFTIATKTPRL